MAEGSQLNRDTMPRKGSVQNVCRQWLVHEDGAMAYREQNKEIEQHYGLNRFNRRTVREDIPVARVVQSDEEQRQQEERYEELQALRAQAEEDEEIARRVNQEIIGEEEARRRQRELEDEEIAREYQEKEKKKYEKYMEKKREKELKKERVLLEKQLEQHIRDARLVAEDTGDLEGQMQNVHMDDSPQSGDRRSVASRQGAGSNPVRVTPGGRIEDNDFSDFFTIPDDVSDGERRAMQEMQDEELARLLQEQEHKRTKAEVDRNKLKEIEEQDARLAKIIQEQDKLKVKRAKQRKKQQQQEEMRRQQQQQQHHQINHPASRPLPDLPGHRHSSSEPVPPPQQASQERSRLRRHSFLQGIDNGPVPSNVQNSSSRQHSHPPMNSRGELGNLELPHNSVREVERWLATTESATRGHSSNHTRGRLRSDSSIPSDDHMPPSPSPPGSYHSEEEIPYRPPIHRTLNVSDREEPCYAVSNPIPFNNIAAAIDPTFQRRQHEIHNDETDIKVPALVSL